MKAGSNPRMIMAIAFCISYYMITGILLYIVAEVSPGEMAMLIGLIFGISIKQYYHPMVKVSEFIAGIKLEDTNK